MNFQNDKIENVAGSIWLKYNKQDQQEKAAFSERNPHMTQQQELVAKSPGGPQTKTAEQGRSQHGQFNH
jgi:hypothetical protein